MVTRTNENASAPGLQIGASVEAIEAGRDAILAILSTQRGDGVVKAALDAFVHIAAVSNVTVQDSTFYAGGSQPATVSVP